MNFVELPDDTDTSAIVLLSELSKRIPDGPSYCTLYKHSKYGLKSESGKIVKMQTVRLTTGRGASIDFYLKFIEDLNS